MCVMQIWCRWIPCGFFAGAIYVVIGVGFAPLSTPSVFFWRLAAWVVSAVVFAAHIGYEHFRLRSLPRETAMHAALGAGLGSFGLAAAATVHALLTGTGSLRLLRIALVVWPVITAIPAFIVALTLSSLLARLPRYR
jgi:hypothetical protein